MVAQTLAPSRRTAVARAARIPWATRAVDTAAHTAERPINRLMDMKR
jgi:hypothetical protein